MKDPFAFDPSRIVRTIEFRHGQAEYEVSYVTPDGVWRNGGGSYPVEDALQNANSLNDDGIPFDCHGAAHEHAYWVEGLSEDNRRAMLDNALQDEERKQFGIMCQACAHLREGMKEAGLSAEEVSVLVNVPSARIASYIAFDEAVVRTENLEEVQSILRRLENPSAHDRMRLAALQREAGDD